MMRFAFAQMLAAGIVVAALVGASFAATHVQAQEASRLTDAEFQRLYDRMTGIWDFQPDKSTYTREDPPKRWYVIYEADGGEAIKYTNRSCDADGQESVRVSRQVLDGEDYARSGSDTSIARLPVDEFTISTTIKTAGTLTARNTQFFSADGQRMTITLRRSTEEGEYVTTINVYDKVDRRLPVCAA